MRRFAQFIFDGVLFTAMLLTANYVFCTLGFSVLPEGGGDPNAVGFFDSWVTKALAGIMAFIVITVIGLFFVVRSRRGGLLAVGWLIDLHSQAKRRSYHALWLEKRAVRLWKRVNPKDGKKTAAAIGRVIEAGYGLDPAAMPKKVKEAPVYEGPTLVVTDDGMRRAA